MAKLFKLEILTPDRDFFKGEIESLIINTKNGEMGVLYNTLPMVTNLESGIIKIYQSDKWMEAVNAEGFVRISKEGVTIMSSNCEWPYEINVNKVNEEILDINDKIKKTQSLREYKMAKAQLAIQLAKLKIKGKGL